MNIKIEIKNRFTGNVLFTYESENNTIKETLVKSVEQGADLQGADLQGADLRCADLRCADLQDADLRCADLQGADLRCADLQGADLQGADLQGAYLRCADLRDADLQGAYLRDEKISKAIVFTGLYKYIVIPYITESGDKRVKMGCHDRTVEEWDSNFWNNNDEFPNDNSLKSNLRMMAYNTARTWFDLIQKRR